MREIGVDSILELLKTLDDLPEPERELEAPLLMPVIQTHEITGRGIVLVGTIEQGVLRKGQHIEVRVTVFYCFKKGRFLYCQVKLIFLVRKKILLFLKYVFYKHTDRYRIQIKQRILVVLNLS